MPVIRQYSGGYAGEGQYGGTEAPGGADTQTAGGPLRGGASSSAVGAELCHTQAEARNTDEGAVL